MSRPQPEELRRFPLFASASEVDLSALARATFRRPLPTHARLISEGEESREVYLLESGKVGVFYSSPDGTAVLVKVFSAPSFFGEMEAFFRRRRQEYVEAFEPASVLVLEVEAFEHFLSRCHPACLLLVRDLAARLSIAAYHERALCFHDVETRIASLFLTFAEAYGRPQGGGILIDYRLTYELIARCLGITLKSVERAIGRWKASGLVTVDRGRYQVLALDDLEALADPERLSLHSALGRPPGPSNTDA